jgi:hypothetical protein
MNTSLDFEKLKGRCLKILNENNYISLATALNNRVKARVVDYVNLDLTIGFITWTHTEKMDHLKDNPAVSLCINNLQIEGKALVSGHPGLPENRAFGESFQKRNPNPYKNFIAMEDVTTIMVPPSLMILMTYADKHLYSDHLDIIRNTAFRKVLSPWNAEL